MAAYVNEYYRPEHLVAVTGRDHVLSIPNLAGSGSVEVGAVFWFVISLLAVYFLWAGAKRLIVRKRSGAAQEAA
jgi:hypothetical protein